jgi:putative tryptophan/tyrosine transport system substrate-binding protein
MKRRDFIAGLVGAAAWPLAVRAQQGERVRRVGFLSYGEDTVVGSTSIRTLLRDDLEQLGWSEGRNLRIDFRFGDGDARKTSTFAADLLQLAPEVIVTQYGAALRALQQQTKTIPIVVAAAGDLLENGSVRNPAHPEGNTTGFANAFGSLGGKWVELLKDGAPNITRVLYMSASNRGGGSYLRSVETAAQLLGVKVVATRVSDPAGMRAAIAAFAAEPNGGLLPNPNMFAIASDELIRLAAQYHLPAIYGGPLPPGSGELMSYNPDLDELFLGAARYVDRLLRGAKVSDLPVQYPTKFRLVINLKTAKTLGLDVPPSILVRADQVIE